MRGSEEAIDRSEIEEQRGDELHQLFFEKERDWPSTACSWTCSPPSPARTTRTAAAAKLRAKPSARRQASTRAAPRTDGAMTASPRCCAPGRSGRRSGMRPAAAGARSPRSGSASRPRRLAVKPDADPSRQPVAGTIARARAAPSLPACALGGGRIAAKQTEDSSSKPAANRLRRYARIESRHQPWHYSHRWSPSVRGLSRQGMVFLLRWRKYAP